MNSAFALSTQIETAPETVLALGGLRDMVRRRRALRALEAREQSAAQELAVVPAAAEVEEELLETVC